VSFGRIWVGEVELSEQSRDGVVVCGLDGYRRARVLVRLHRQPLGFVNVPVEAGAVSRGVVWRAARSELHDALWDHLLGDVLDEHHGLSVSSCPRWAPPPSRSVSVVIATRERAGLLASCLEGLRKLRYAPLEIVVVDNAPRSGATAQLVELRRRADSRIRYVLEATPGMARAQNRGVREASGEIVAFTDDDVVVDEWWLNAIMDGFSRDPRVACVTGIVPTAELESLAQLYFDQRVSWSSSCRRRVYGLVDHADSSPLYPYLPGIFGTGANCAFARDFFVRMGGFDERLGPGTRTLGGSDIDAFVRTLLEGGLLAYEPAAIVWHFHRATMRDLRRQMFAYGAGLTAFATKHLMDPRTALQVLARVPRGVTHAAGMWRRGDARPDLKRSMAGVELYGMLTGPMRYLLSQRQDSRRRARIH